MDTKQLVDRQVYKIVSRNLNVGVWDKSNEWFIGIRYKFGEYYLDIEDDTVAKAEPYDPPVVVGEHISLDFHSGALFAFLSPLNAEAEGSRWLP